MWCSREVMLSNNEIRANEKWSKGQIIVKDTYGKHANEPEVGD